MYGPEADLNAYATFIWPRCPTAALHGRREATVAGYVMPGGHEAHPETSGQPQTGDYGQRETRYTMNTHTPRRDPHENYEHEYRAIVQTSLDGFLRTDTSGRILEVNQAYCQMTDYSEPELLGKSISDIEFLETPAETARRIQEIIATGACRFESRHRRKDGSPVDVEVSVTYRPDPDGQILSFTRDITERKTREAVTAARMRLQQYALNHPLHDLLRATLDEAEQLTNSCIGFYHFVEADQETLTLQQWSSNTVKNMCTAEGAGAHYPISAAGVWCDCVNQRRSVIHNDYMSLPHRKGVPAGHAPIQRELVVPVLRGNQIVAILGVGNKPSDYTPVDVQAVESLADLAWDIAEIKLSEERYQEAADRFGHLMENAEIWVWEVDASGLYTYSSPVVTKLLGYTPDELVGKMHFYDLFAPQGQAELTAAALAAFRSAQPFRDFQNPNRHKSGYDVILETNGIPILDTNGTLQGYRGSDKDVTARVRAEQLLRESEIHHRSLIEHIPGIVYIFSSTRGGIYYSPQVTSILGYTPEQLYAQPTLWHDSIHPENVPTVEKNIQDAFHGAGFCFEYRIRDAHGAWHWFDDRSIECVVDGREVIFKGFAYDITEKVRAEEQTRLNALVLDQIQDCVTVTDMEGRIQYVNNSQCETVKRSRDELIGQSIAILGANPLRGATQDEILAATLAHGAWQGEVVNIATDGREITVNCRTQVVRDEQGRVVALAGFGTDITEQKRAADINRKLAAIVESTDDAIIGKDLDGVITSWNLGAERMYGYTAAEILGRPIADLVPPDRIDEPRRFIEIIRNHGHLRHYETTRLHKDGTSIDVSITVSAVLDQSGAVVGISTIARDVSDRKQAERSLRESESRFRTLFEKAGLGVAVIDLPSHRFVQVNQKYCDFLGYTQREMSALAIEAITHPDDIAASVQQLDRLTACEINQYTLEKRYIAKDGATVWANVTVSALGDASESNRYHMVIAEDITNRKLAEEEKARLEEQLRQSQKMEAVGQLAGGIAHDFNNLLLIITGYTAMVIERLSSDSEDRADLEEVHKAAERAASLTRQLLTFSRRQVMQPVRLDLNLLIEDDLKMVRRVIGEHIELRYMPSDQPAIIQADKGQLGQVVMNLCVNARDAMDTGGALTIRTDVVAFDEHYCDRHSWARPGRFVLLEMTDTGRGMDNHTRTHLFEPFFTTKEVGQGTGLGLSTVYGIVRQNAGLIDVESEPGQGSVFRVYFPSVNSPAETHVQAADTQTTTGAETILVAEDEDGVRKLLRRILESSGYTVLTAIDGEDALAVFEQHENDIALAILDVMMPKLSGRQVMERIQARCPRMRFLFASGYSPDAIHTDFVVDEGIRLVPKPYQKSSLLKAIRDELDGQRDTTKD